MFGIRVRWYWNARPVQGFHIGESNTIDVRRNAKNLLDEPNTDAIGAAYYEQLLRCEGG